MNAEQLRAASYQVHAICCELCKLGLSLHPDFTQVASDATTALWLLRERLARAAYDLEHPAATQEETDAAIDELRKDLGL